LAGPHPSTIRCSTDERRWTDPDEWPSIGHEGVHCPKESQLRGPSTAPYRTRLASKRYDDLIESFGGKPTPAVGVAPGYATLSLLLQRAGVWPEETLATDYYVLQVGDTRPVAARVARELRERGHVVESDVAGRSFGAQLDYADSIGAETVVIVGEQDLANDEVTVKDMETGDQTTAPVDDFPGDRGRPTYDDFA
jgi:histidyl-tRNA synthetase